MDKVITRPSTDEYREGWELVFGKKPFKSKALTEARKEAKKELDKYWPIDGLGEK